MKGPTQRSMKLLRDRKALPFKVERYNPYTRTTTDLYHFIDIVAIERDVSGVLGVQTTAQMGNLHARIRKAESLSAYFDWLAAMNDVEFHGWRKLKGGTKVAKWTPKIIRVSVRDLFT